MQCKSGFQAYDLITHIPEILRFYWNVFDLVCKNIPSLTYICYMQPTAPTCNEINVQINVGILALWVCILAINVRDACQKKQIFSHFLETRVKNVP